MKIVELKHKESNLLKAFEADLIKWNNKHNLISKHDVNHIRKRHITNCFIILHFLNDYDVVADIGSGGGFPGLVIAIYFSKNTSHNLFLVEKDNKKCSFLISIAANYNLPAKIYNKSFESFTPDLILNAITCRAVDALHNLFELSLKYFSYGVRGYFLKGESYKAEIEEAAKTFYFCYEVYENIYSENSVLIVVNSLSMKKTRLVQ